MALGMAVLGCAFVVGFFSSWSTRGIPIYSGIWLIIRLFFMHCIVYSQSLLQKKYSVMTITTYVFFLRKRIYGVE